MSILDKDEHFERACDLPMSFARKKLRFSTDLTIARTIGKATDLDKTLPIMEKICEEANTDEEIIRLMKERLDKVYIVTEEEAKALSEEE